MTQHPDSWFTQFRRRLAKAIEPGPAPGEAWCVNCVINEGDTLIISPDGIEYHLQKHLDEHPGDDHVLVQSSWLPGRGPSR